MLSCTAQLNSEQKANSDTANKAGRKNYKMIRDIYG